MFDLELESKMGERGGKRQRNINSYPTPSPFRSFILSLGPLVQIFFSPQSYPAVNIKDGSYNCHQNKSERSPVEIAPALQATVKPMQIKLF